LEKTSKNHTIEDHNRELCATRSARRGRGGLGRDNEILGAILFQRPGLLVEQDIFIRY